MAEIIKNGTIASVVRKSMENRAQLPNKGDIYIGTGGKIEEGSTIPDTKGQNIIDAINDNQTNEKYVQLKDENNLKTYLLKYIYPVGSIKMTTENINPKTYLGGTWVKWGAGKVPVGVDTTDADFAAVEKTGGEKEHTLTIDEMPSHSHNYTKLQSTGYIGSVGSSGDVLTSTDTTTGTTGGGQSHNNMPPYITVYMFKRTL